MNVLAALALACGLAAACRAVPEHDAPEPAERAPVVAAPALKVEPHVQSLGREDGLLWLDYASTGGRATDLELAAALEPWVGRVAELGLARTNAGAETLAVVARMASLERLDLRATRLASADLEALSSAQGLTWLNLAETKLDATAVERLARLPALRRVFVWNAGLDDVTLTAWREQRPQLAVDSGPPSSSALESEPPVTLGPAQPTASVPVNVTCPVLDTPVNPAHTTLFEGRRIGFCCGSCKARFEADPASFRSKLP